MKKIISVNGMQCEHCKASVEKALYSVEGVTSVKVDLKKKTAAVAFDGEVSDSALSAAVTEAGFEVTGIEAKKGLFG